MKPINIIASNLLNQQLQIKVPLQEWGYETTLLYRDELDDRWVKNKENLPQKVMVDTAIYEDQKNEYLVFRLWNLEKEQVVSLGILKKDQLIYLEEFNET